MWHLYKIICSCSVSENMTEITSETHTLLPEGSGLWSKSNYLPLEVRRQLNSLHDKVSKVSTDRRDSTVHKLVMGACCMVHTRRETELQASGGRYEG